jgi:hypothetical protein
VLAEEGKAKAIAFDEIDKAPEEKKRGITIATVGIAPPHTTVLHAFHIPKFHFLNTLMSTTFSHFRYAKNGLLFSRSFFSF